MTKRLAAAFGLLLLGALVLTACGGGGEGPPPTPAGSWDLMNWDQGFWR